MASKTGCSRLSLIVAGLLFATVVCGESLAPPPLVPFDSSPENRTALPADSLSGAPQAQLAPARAVPTATVGRIALIIDDLGNWSAAGARTVALPGPVACAVLPHTPFGATIANLAVAQGKEVMLHLPLEPIAYRDIADGTIGIDTTQDQLVRILSLSIKSVPNVVGVNNHMGSLLTQHPGHMRWLMAELARRGDLFFVDSYTSEQSVAWKIAREEGLPSIRRDVFLDNVPTIAAVAREFERLKSLAKRNRVAVGIGHPYPATLTYLESALPELAAEGIELISVAELIRYREAPVIASVTQQ